jgi:hypothetical protein
MFLLSSLSMLPFFLLFSPNPIPPCTKRNSFPLKHNTLLLNLLAVRSISSYDARSDISVIWKERSTDSA